MKNRALKFTGLIIREGEQFSSLCLELDVASSGKSAAQAKRMLKEAVALHLETSIESNLPYLRSVPPSENPLFTSPEIVIETFDLDVAVRLIAHAA